MGIAAIRKGSLVLVVALVAVGASAGTSSAVAISASAVKCGTSSTGRQVCVAPSSVYPRTVGWYGYVKSTSPCNGAPFPGYFAPGTAAICSLPGIPAFRWNAATKGWESVTLRPDMSGYIQYYVQGWRWFYTAQTGWVAVEHSHLQVRWNP